MTEQLNYAWVPKLADLLVFEVLEQLSGIRVTNSPAGEPSDTAMDTVYGFVDGEYRMQMHFRAEPRMFGRLAGNMMGEPPQEEDIRDYAEEFFNILCGRFVSEIYRTTQMKARFLPTRYGEPPKASWGAEEGISYTRYFVSEERELAEFSWTVSMSENSLEGAKSEI